MAALLHLLLGTLLTVSAVHGHGELFADLSADELKAVQVYLESQSEIQLISHLNAKVKDPYLWLVEAYRPNKTEALSYLDDGKPAPARAARAIIHRGDMTPAQVQEYKVWPLPNPANHEQIKNTNWKDPIPFHARSPFAGFEEGIIEPLIYKEFVHVESIISQATGGYTFRSNCTGKCLRFLPAMPGSSSSGNHQLTGYFVRDIEGGYLYPIGLQFVLVVNSLDETEWTIGSVWFQGKRFQSFRDMASKMANSDPTEVILEPEDANKPSLDSSMNFRGDPRPAGYKRGPVTCMPDGPRYEVVGRHVSWLGWEFDFGMLTSSGIQLFDIRFLKERIIYELALQELSVFYSGGSPIAQHTNYYDSVLVFGLFTAQMFPGLDCPQYAQFFDFIHYVNGQPQIFKNGACVFEHNRGIPLRRHYETDFKAKAGYRFASGMPDNVLVLRHMLTALNYDYIVDVMFHQGGQVEVKVSLNGYVLSTFYTGQGMDKYGHRINDAHAIGNLHHHTANFKVDMDIKGTKNRFETLDIKLEEIEDTLTPDEKLQNRYVERSMKKTEREAAYHYNFDTPKYLVVYNEQEKTQFGDHRGYRLYNAAVSKMLLPTTYRGNRGRAFTNYQVAVTKHKEDERCSSSVYTATEPFDPVMSFEDFIGDESIVDEDVVMWVTMGSHHIPHTEDVPIVSTTGVQLTFYLLPYNYFDEDPSMASRDNIRVTPNDYPTDKQDEHKYYYSGLPDPPKMLKCSSGGAATPSVLLLLLLVAFSLTKAL